MTLREDSDPYCLTWTGFLLLGSYYANFGYMIWTDVSARVTFSANALSMTILLILPIVMIIFFVGYLRPSHGKAKMSMLGPSVLAALFFIIISYQVSTASDILGNLTFFSAWGIGSALITAGGFATMQSLKKSVTHGILDIASLHYGSVGEESKSETEGKSIPETKSPAEKP